MFYTPLAPNIMIGIATNKKSTSQTISVLCFTKNEFSFLLSKHNLLSNQTPMRNAAAKDPPMIITTSNVGNFDKKI
jgi:hypothetical protein